MKNLKNREFKEAKFQEAIRNAFLSDKKFSYLVKKGFEWIIYWKGDYEFGIKKKYVSVDFNCQLKDMTMKKLKLIVESINEIISLNRK